MIVLDMMEILLYYLAMATTDRIMPAVSMMIQFSLALMESVVLISLQKLLATYNNNKECLDPYLRMDRY